MPEQAETNLKYLNHALRNGTVSIQACLRQIETILKDMNAAIKTYISDLENMIPDEKEKEREP